MPVINFTPEEHAWASKSAMRLRFVQADFADRPAEERRSFLEDEVQRALKDIAADKRPRYAQALAEHFPTGFITKEQTVDTNQDSPEALVEALVKIASKLPKSLLAALDALEGEPLFRSEMGNLFIDYYLAFKRVEAGRFMEFARQNDLDPSSDEITDWEQNEYFDFF